MAIRAPSELKTEAAVNDVSNLRKAEQDVWAGRDRSWFGKSGGSDPAPGTCACPPYPALPPAPPPPTLPPGRAPPGKLLALSVSGDLAPGKVCNPPSIYLLPSPPFEPCNQVETSGNSQGCSFYTTHSSSPSVWAYPHSNWTDANRINCTFLDDGTIIDASIEIIPTSDMNLTYLEWLQACWLWFWN